MSKKPDTVKMLKMDGYDDCIIGICERYGMSPVIAYDRVKVLQKLVNGGMNQQEAQEFYEYNQIGAWMGDGTPVFVTRMPLKQLREEE